MCPLRVELLLIVACCCAASTKWGWALCGENELSDWVLLLSAARPCAASCVALNLQLSRRRSHYYFTHRHSLLDFQNARNIWNICPPLRCRNHRGALIEFHSHAAQKHPLDISFQYQLPKKKKKK